MNNGARIGKRGWWRDQQTFFATNFARPRRRRSSWTLWSSSGSRSYGWDQWCVIGPTTKKQWDEANPFVFLYCDVSPIYCSSHSIIYLSISFKSLQSFRFALRYTISNQHFLLLEKTLFKTWKRVRNARCCTQNHLITGCRYNQILEIEAGYIEMLLEIDALFSRDMTSASLSTSCSNGTFLPNYRRLLLRNNFVVTSLIRSRYQSADRLCG